MLRQHNFPLGLTNYNTSIRILLGFQPHTFLFYFHSTVHMFLHHRVHIYFFFFCHSHSVFCLYLSLVHFFNVYTHIFFFFIQFISVQFLSKTRLGNFNLTANLKNIDEEQFCLFIFLTPLQMFNHTFRRLIIKPLI